MRIPITATMGSERTANRLLIALFYEVNSSAKKKMNIMCAFHTYDKLVFSLRGRRDGTGGVLFMANEVVSASKLKTQKFRSFNNEEFGKFGKVVLTRLVPRKAIGMRFEEG